MIGRNSQLVLIVSTFILISLFLLYVINIPKPTDRNISVSLERVYMAPYPVNANKLIIYSNGYYLGSFEGHKYYFQEIAGYNEKSQLVMVTRMPVKAKGRSIIWMEAHQPPKIIRFKMKIYSNILDKTHDDNLKGFANGISSFR